MRSRSRPEGARDASRSRRFRESRPARASCPLRRGGCAGRRSLPVLTGRRLGARVSRRAMAGFAARREGGPRGRMDTIGLTACGHRPAFGFRPSARSGEPPFEPRPDGPPGEMAPNAVTLVTDGCRGIRGFCRDGDGCDAPPRLGGENGRFHSSWNLPRRRTDPIGRGGLRRAGDRAGMRHDGSGARRVPPCQAPETLLLHGARTRFVPLAGLTVRRRGLSECATHLLQKINVEISEDAIC